MAGRSPARFLAPVALVAFAVALLMVVQHARDTTGGNPASGVPAKSASPASHSKSGKKAPAKRRRKTYVVRAGDTPSGIAEKTGVTVEQLVELNPDMDPQTLAPGQRLRLAK